MRVSFLTAVVFGTFLAVSRLAACGAEPAVLEISANTTLDPAKTYGAIKIMASDITIDGRGAALVGATTGDAKTFTGTAIFAKGVSHVTLKNVKAKGFETGLQLEDAEGWTVEGCDFSDNFNDPKFGWGENGRRGGIVLQRVTKTTLRKNKANRVWDACVLVDSNENRIEGNDFSHASNTCLKMWNASRNDIRDNDLSYGLRIDPGEVHARDSTSVLIESGSNDNHFVRNNCTHGGDGIFIRVLNGWVSTGNVFEENDCSYANNNCFEAWSPRNTYRKNKANHGSYGFWLGASDQTVLEDNEASFNGDPKGFHNSAHLPNAGHAGIVFMFGPSSHTIARGNVCEGNNGAGIAIIGDMESQGEKWKAFHWIAEKNTLKGNRWGFFVQAADWIELNANRFADNTEGNVFQAGAVTNLIERPEKPGISAPPKAALAGPASSVAGKAFVLDASASRDPASKPLAYRWDLGDGTIATTARVEHVFKTPGFYRVGLTVTNGALSDLAWRDFYVTEDVTEFGTEGSAAAWTWDDPQSKVAFTDDRTNKITGRSSIAAVVAPYGGGRVALVYPAAKNAAVPLAKKSKLIFWIKAVNENTTGWQDCSPQVTLEESAGKQIVLTPKADMMRQCANNEQREGWNRFEVPLDGNDVWIPAGEKPATLNALKIGFDSWESGPLRIWIDGMAVE